jgi:hypothetical protein
MEVRGRTPDETHPSNLFFSLLDTMSDAYPYLMANG